MFTHNIKQSNILTNANLSNSYLDSKQKITMPKLKTIVAHLKDRQNYPTLGTLAHRKFLTKNEPQVYLTKLTELRQFETFKKLEKGIKESIKKLYPKTKNIRRILLHDERIILDKVKPIEHNIKHKLVKLLGKIL